MMNWERVWNVLRWVLAVLAAGFVGHFGRVLAEWIIHRRARRTEASSPERYAAELEKKRVKAQMKLEKKRIKAEAKRRKKEE
ncbi:hypothetical protein DRJ23_03935 [Candidatus Acetothermia bacterium]|nr:MAG: hypothetical protein DRJ23_03935 [Candidatus Acetothermia bacterium]